MRYRPFPLSAFDPITEKRVAVGGFTPVARIFLPASASAMPITLATGRSEVGRRAALSVRRVRRGRSV